MSVTASIYRQSTYNSPAGSTDPGVWDVMTEINLIMQQPGTDQGKITAIEGVVRLNHPTATTVTGYVYYMWTWNEEKQMWIRYCFAPTTITIPEPPADPIILELKKQEVNQVGA